MKRLSGWDAMLLYSETPNVPTHTLKIVIVNNDDGTFTFERFRKHVQSRLPELGPLRYQLLETPLGLHHPMWLEDVELDLDRHLRRAAVAPPGGRRELDEVIGDIAIATLERDRPLWEMYFVEGLANLKVAAVVKIHHALADGVATANLLAMATDPARQPDEEPRTSTRRAPSRAELLAAAGRDHVRQVKGLPALIRDTASGVVHVRRRARQRGRHPELARPLAPPSSIINHLVSQGRRFASCTIPLADAKEAGKIFGVTLNDVVLALSAGALRTVLLGAGEHLDAPLIASVPVNTDPRSDRISGNALGALFVSLPVNVDDPIKRMVHTAVATGVAKENNVLRGPELIGRWTDYMPPRLSSTGLQRIAARSPRNRLYNLSISNVPGPRRPWRIGEHAIDAFFSVGPLTAGSAMNITVWSYADQLNFSVLTDDRLGDPHDVTEAVAMELTAVREGAGLTTDRAHSANVDGWAVTR